ncbi:FKBP-type peptidyl-prolyl cis-trans isomerase [Serratia microhaemolytica]|uniref:FKBP-type peptidyl-prolyl cis-trans isomerase n=1 Tax=Serratia microhaemolytica TaxID=2675110 RepID=UPI000FDD6D13|nr:FKBP-type peptidyl-prolyl cis-trans isomerase [Serratia microhaemolytica]
MKSLFKVALLTSTMALALNTAQVMAADAAKPSKPAAASKFKSEDEQAAYALGASLGLYMENSLKEQEKLGIKLSKNQLLAGVQDVFGGKNKLTNEEIESALQSFETRVRTAAQAKMDLEAKENETKGAKYAENFAKEKGVKKTESGLLYKVEKEGSGVAPQEADTITVNYKGSLIDGTVFDSSYERGEPLRFRMDSVIPGWTEGLKYIKKGGKIQLVIPPELAYGKANVPGIPVNSTLVFDIELIEVEPADQADQ